MERNVARKTLRAATRSAPAANRGPDRERPRASPAARPSCRAHREAKERGHRKPTAAPEQGASGNFVLTDSPHHGRTDNPTPQVPRQAALPGHFLSNAPIATTAGLS